MVVVFVQLLSTDDAMPLFSVWCIRGLLEFPTSTTVNTRFKIAKGPLFKVFPFLYNLFKVFPLQSRCVAHHSVTNELSQVGEDSLSPITFTPKSCSFEVHMLSTELFHNYVTSSSSPDASLTVFTPDRGVWAHTAALSEAVCGGSSRASSKLIYYIYN